MGIDDSSGTVDNIIQVGSSAALDLETLTSQYDAYLMVYEFLLSYYQHLLIEFPTGNFPYAYFNSTQYLGTTVGTPTTVSDASSCSTGCASTTGCTGATYNSNTQICSFTSGYGTMTDASSNFIAIIQANIAALLNMQSVNATLLDINSKIIDIVGEDQTIYKSANTNIEKEGETLIQNQVKLNQERVKLEHQIKSYEDLNKELSQGNIGVTQNYTYYKLLVFIAIVLVIIIIVFTSTSSSSENININNTGNQQGSNISTNTYLIIFVVIFIIILVIVFIKYYLYIYSVINNPLNFFQLSTFYNYT